MAKRITKRSKSDTPEKAPAKGSSGEPLDEMETDDEEPGVIELFDDGDDTAQSMFEQLEEMGIQLPVDEDGPFMLDDEDEDELDEEFDETKLEAVGMADDPVRMYLKEIGQVQLLNPN